MPRHECRGYSVCSLLLPKGSSEKRSLTTKKEWFRPLLFCLLNLGYLVFRFHLGEEDDVSDAVGAGHEHDEAVDAEAQTAGGRHAVFKGSKEKK